MSERRRGPCICPLIQDGVYSWPHPDCWHAELAAKIKQAFQDFEDGKLQLDAGLPRPVFNRRWKHEEG